MDDQNRLVVRDFPFGSLLFGAAFVAFAVFVYDQDPSQVVFCGLFGGIGLLMILATSMLVVTVDRSSGLLTLRHQHLFWATKKEIPIHEIAFVQVERSTSQRSSRRSSGPTYRVVLVTRSQETIPFRAYYSSGAGPKMKMAEKVRSFLGVSGNDQAGPGLFGTANLIAQQAFQKRQEEVSGPNAEIRVTDGVHWSVQTLAYGGTGITRWFSPDFRIAGGFLYLAQKVAGQKTIGGGLLSGVNKLLYQQSLSLYGFGAEDTPAMERAELLTGLDPDLEQHFGAFGSDPAAARQVLNAWVIGPLADWGRRYPLEQIQREKVFKQLGVLYSPRGVYLATMGTLIPEAIDELTRLGVELVKAQGSPAGQPGQTSW